MEGTLHQNKTFEKIIFTEKELRNREFEECTFISCDFLNSNLSGNTFTDCTFISTNLTMVKLQGTSLKNVHFKESKVMGVDFSKCKDFLFSVSFDNCMADYASFAAKKMVKTKFINCSLKGTQLAGTDLTSARFDHCNLDSAVFNKTILNGADFTTAYNFTIDPEMNSLKKAKFSMGGLSGLLNKYDLLIE
ncbi:pentapeptide repeat-containing protein [Sporocytophaga myxococcoides]|nr:pentapeptide repeat-containing protein [Sporocytophaga myxococcoides]